MPGVATHDDDGFITQIDNGLDVGRPFVFEDRAMRCGMRHGEVEHRFALLGIGHQRKRVNFTAFEGGPHFVPRADPELDVDSHRLANGLHQVDAETVCLAVLRDQGIGGIIEFAAHNDLGALA